MGLKVPSAEEIFRTEGICPTVSVELLFCSMHSRTIQLEILTAEFCALDLKQSELGEVSDGKSPPALSTQTTVARLKEQPHCLGLTGWFCCTKGALPTETMENRGGFHVKWRLKLPLEPALRMSRDEQDQTGDEQQGNEGQNKGPEPTGKPQGSECESLTKLSFGALSSVLTPL